MLVAGSAGPLQWLAVAVISLPAAEPKETLKMKIVVCQEGVLHGMLKRVGVFHPRGSHTMSFVADAAPLCAVGGMETDHCRSPAGWQGPKVQGSE